MNTLLAVVRTNSLDYSAGQELAGGNLGAKQRNRENTKTCRATRTFTHQTKGSVHQRTFLHNTVLRTRRQQARRRLGVNDVQRPYNIPRAFALRRSMSPVAGDLPVMPGLTKREKTKTTLHVASGLKL
ncbi:hypothetical protein L798_10974 [Zootermopsis nevadensis]|uniref:Uncharacterized protein n=1 Tax=Zootermopsis nevadensis TaxID=136037 RepID=A0A067QY27_ZOONE|nr:hypothetical protein L798_10974 [Zootermopsis nevadensis]